jgi:hypothetical protein
MAKSNKPTGVTRVEIPSNHTFGWMMRIMRGKKKLLEWFPDKKLGGSEKARIAAAKRYEELAKELPAPQVSSKNRMSKRNTTGKVGVYVKEGFGRKGNETAYYSFAAFWMNAVGKKDFITFAWLKYGDSLAWKMACYARDNELKDRVAIENRFGFKEQ